MTTNPPAVIDADAFSISRTISIAASPDRVVGVVVLHVRDGKVSDVHAIAAPDRLGRLTDQWRRSEHDDPLIASW